MERLEFTSPPHIKEWARNVGREYPDQEYLLTEYDSWERNPWFTGKPGRHPEADPEPVAIKAAWFSDQRATVGGKRCGYVYARDEAERIYRHRITEFHNPRQFVEAINRAGVIDLDCWDFHADDSEAVAYFANQTDGEDR